jgi:hypothetical protein
MSTPADHDPSERVPLPEPTPSTEAAVKPRWTRPEITSFKPVADAQGVSYRIGDGVSNLSI